jgi:CoA:oxalate CoA-transferase
MDETPRHSAVRPLDGIRVLDLSRFVSGPLPGRIFADLGADVVKVESPDGDGTRQFGKVQNGLSGVYTQYNAGKRNVCLDLKAPGAAELIGRLAEQADVVIENFRPGVMRRLGIAWEILSARNPRLVMLSVSGFGQEGPEANRPAYAAIIHAESGWVGRQQEMLGGGFRDSVFNFADALSGLHGAVAVLAALRLRDRTGIGQHVDLAMLDAWIASDDYASYVLDGEPMFYQGGEVWQTPFGALMLNRDVRHVWKCLRTTHGLVAPTPPGADSHTKVAARRDVIAGWMESFADEHALTTALEKAGLAWGRVRSSQSLLDSPTVRTRGVAVEIDDGAGGKRRVVRMPYRFSSGDAGVRGPAPRLGEHNREVLAEWGGFAVAEIDALVANGTVRDGDGSLAEAAAASR